jgi:hypothetical protein
VPGIPQMGPAFQGAAAAAWQEEEGSEETEGGLPEGVVLVRQGSVSTGKW